MTSEQVEQAVRKVVGQDANPRKVQALMWAVERYGIGWLETTYQPRQQRETATARQHTSRQRITLDWADVEAWVKRQQQTSENWVVGGYYTTCPVPTHKTDDLISVWSGKDGGLGLKCWGNCTYSAIHEALADAIKTGAPSITEPPAAADARIKELEESLAAANDRASQSDREHAVLENSNGEMQDELETLRGDKGELANKLDTKAEEVDALQEEKSSLENSLSSAKDRREQLRRERDSAKRKLSRRDKKISDLQNDVEELQEEKTSLETNLAAASKATQDDANNDPEGAALVNRIQNLQAESSSLENRLTAAKAESDDLLEAAEEERDREHSARIAAETRARDIEREKSRLQTTLTTTIAKRDQERAARITATKTELERGGNGRLSSAWRLLSKDEPTYAFIDAVCILENDLHQLVGHGQWPRPQLERMLTAACELHFIDEKKQGKLQEMRRKRNRILHQNQRLGGPQVHNDLAYLERVVGQLGS